MAKQNYRQAKGQKEVARKTRQLEKQQKRTPQQDAPACANAAAPPAAPSTATP